MAELDDEELARLLVALGDYVPPAEIGIRVPAHGEPVGVDDHRRRGLLLSSIGPIVVMMASAFAYIEQLFQQTGYDVNALFNAPEFGEYLIHLTPEQRQVFCANTAYYIDAMRHNKPLEVITDEAGVKRFKPLSSSGSTAVTMTPSSTMTLNGNEVIEKNEENGKLVYKQGQTEIVVPEDPLEMSAFCMAHFFNTENVQILMNWGENFKLISEEDLLRLLGQMGEGNDWKQRVVGKLLRSAYDVHNQTAAFNRYISTFPNPVSQLRDFQHRVDLEWEMFRYRLPGITKEVLYQFAIAHPNLYAAISNAINYPIPSSFFVFVVLYYLNKPLRAFGYITYEVALFPYRILNWLTGRNPDRPGADLLAIGNGDGDGDGGAMVRRGGGKQQPLSVIVINHPSPSLYLDKLAKIFDEDGSIDSFLKNINPVKISISMKLKKQITKALKSIQRSFKKLSLGISNKNRRSIVNKNGSKKNVREYKSSPPSPRGVDMEYYGGRKRSNKKSTKRKHKNKRKTQKR